MVPTAGTYKGLYQDFDAGLSKDIKTAHMCFRNFILHSHVNQVIHNISK